MVSDLPAKPTRLPVHARYVGFYGCAAKGGTVVRCRAMAAATRQAHPDKATVFCPACKQRHSVQLMWRRAASAKELELAMVSV